MNTPRLPLTAGRYRWMAPSTSNKTTVTNADTSKDPKHPSRLLKNRNTVRLVPR